MKVVFIRGPFRAANAWEVEQNIRRAEALGFEVAKLGAMPMIPHTNTRFFDGTLTDEFWLEGTMELLRRSDAVMSVRGCEKSSGSAAEGVEAKRIGLPVFSDLGQLAAWLEAEKIKGIF